MSDKSVSDALRSDAPVVVVEAPAGCGKTHQAGLYARWIAKTTANDGKLLILTHTHAACDVFRSRTADVATRVSVSTIDGLVSQIAGMYYQTLNLPADVSAWARANGDGFEQLAVKVGNLLSSSRNIARALASRHPIVVCDEHQDANPAQHKVVMALHHAGSRLRVFGDPMQSIYGTGAVQEQQWADLMARADHYEKLDFPHRWAEGSEALGQWVLRAREALKAGDAVDLRAGRPMGLEVIPTHNEALRHGGFTLAGEHGRQLRGIVARARSVLILCSQKATIRGLHAYWGRDIPIWEGHSHEALVPLMDGCKRHRGNARELASVLNYFMAEVAVGFNATFSSRLISEIEAGCVGEGNTKPALLRRIGRRILEEPNHVGVGRALRQINEFTKTAHHFRDVKVDLRREFHDAVRLADYGDADQGLEDISRQRTGLRMSMPNKTLSTIHKAKGLENSHAVVLPCDRAHFADNVKNRCLLYVALSRATTSLTLVVSPTERTTLFRT